MIKYTGKGPSGVTVNGEPVDSIEGPRSLVRALLATGDWTDADAEPKKPARKKRGK